VHPPLPLQAVRLVDALREACVEHVQPEPFNKMIVALASK
jgi:hypothetical protein